MSDYVGTVNQQVIHDKKLMDFFIQEGQKEKANKVKERLMIEIKELESMK